jgi:hypothetical protein
LIRASSPACGGTASAARGYADRGARFRRRRYRRVQRTAKNPRSEWAAAPVPDVGITLEREVAARERAKHNRKPDRRESALNSCRRVEPLRRVRQEDDPGWVAQGIETIILLLQLPDAAQVRQELLSDARELPDRRVRACGAGVRLGANEKLRSATGGPRTEDMGGEDGDPDQGPRRG